jgi:uncharacterized protein
MALLAVAVLVEGGLGGVAWGVGWLINVPPLQTLHGGLWPIVLGVAGSLPLLMLFVLCLHMPGRPLAGLRTMADEVIRPLFLPYTWLELAFISGLAGLGEEMFFRGLLQRLLEECVGTWSGLALASAVFGLLHLLTPAYAVMAALMGAYLGWLWIATGDLLSPVIAHGLYDFLALLYLVRLRAPRHSLPAA